jgi:N-methylhydantoinase B
MTKEGKIDIITMELINNFLHSIVDEMALTVVRTSFSPLIRDSHDYQCGLCDVNGELILEGEGGLGHSMIYPFLIKNLLKEYKASIYPGDTFITNDPYSEAAHLPDFNLLHPIFYEGKLVAWAAANGHMRDVGGRTPGSCACDSTEIYQEGLRIPPVKLYEKGVPNENLYKIIKANSRVPMILIGDMEAYRSACYLGEKGFLKLCRTYGPEKLNMYIKEFLDYAERLTRAEIRAMPEGDYEFTDYLDDDGISTDPIPIHVKITIKGDSITYDFTGTAPQGQGAMNSPLGTTRAIVITALRCMLNPEIPRNGGVWRPIKLIVPEGSFLNPKLPAAVASRGSTMGRQFDVMMGAQAQVAPAKIPACTAQLDTLLNIGGRDKGGKAYVLTETLYGSWGGRPFADGIDYNTSPWLYASNQPCEVNEELFPIQYNQFAYVSDTEGAGKYRGGLAVVREWEYIGDEPAILQLRVDRQCSKPFGLQGGQAGTSLTAILNPRTENRHIGKITMNVKKGDVIRITTAGAGGWGDPLERYVNVVLGDVCNEKLSVIRAREIYGVVINEDTMEVNVGETHKLRETMEKSRPLKSTQHPPFSII